MKCRSCNGTGTWGKVSVEDDLIDTICPKCKGTGTIQPTNEEYMQTCNSEELGCFICENFFHGACGECKFCEITEVRHHCTLGEWLKEKYHG